jgi:hypothetical protein
VKRLAAVWVAMLAFAGATAASCSINHRSDGLGCTNAGDCTAPNSKCEDGVCTSPTGNVDAPKSPDAKQIDAFESVCSDQCTQCDERAKTCLIDCAAGNVDCDKKVICPTGFDCEIRCSGTQDCRSGVDCTTSHSCNVSCSGQTSCRNVFCGDGPCQVGCTGFNSCRSIACNNSCQCDVGCVDQAACEGVVCVDQQCGTFSGGCSSQFFGCSSDCPE